MIAEAILCTTQVIRVTTYADTQRHSYMNTQGHAYMDAPRHAYMDTQRHAYINSKHILVPSIFIVDIQFFFISFCILLIHRLN